MFNHFKITLNKGDVVHGLNCLSHTGFKTKAQLPFMGLGGNTSFKSDMFKIKKARSPFTGPGDIVASYELNLLLLEKIDLFFLFPGSSYAGEYIGPSHKGVGASWS